MARALEAILKELDSVYNPQRDVYNSQMKALPGLQQAELGGLDAAKKDSFNQIVTGANRRGVAFGGIPLEEQADYLGQTYLPAVANLKNRFNQQRFNLQDALAQIGISQRKDAYGIRDQEMAREEAAAARRAAAGGGGGFNLGSVLGAETGPATNPKGWSSDLQNLYNRMFLKPGGGKWGDQELVSDYNATYKSASYGNKADQKKLELYHASRPDLFGAKAAAFAKPKAAAYKPSGLNQYNIPGGQAYQFVNRR